MNYAKTLSEKNWDEITNPDAIDDSDWKETLFPAFNRVTAEKEKIGKKFDAQIAKMLKKCKKEAKKLDGSFLAEVKKNAKTDWAIKQSEEAVNEAINSWDCDKFYRRYLSGNNCFTRMMRESLYLL